MHSPSWGTPSPVYWIKNLIWLPVKITGTCVKFTANFMLDGACVLLTLSGFMRPGTPKMKPEDAYIGRLKQTATSPKQLFLTKTTGGPEPAKHQ